MDEASQLRVLIVPRRGARADSNWYPFVRERAVAGALPGVTDAVVVQGGAGALAAVVGERMEQTVLVGHGSSCTTLLRFLERVEPSAPARGLLCVAGPWPDEPLDHSRARAASRAVRLLISDDDPHMPDPEETARLWAEHMGAVAAVRHGARHFEGAHEISVLINLAALLEQDV